MTYKNTLKLSLCAGAMFVLAACASKATTEEAVTYAEPQNQEEVAILTANELSATKNKTTSVDGKTICKRQAVVGSNFKRKICATAEEWERREEESRASTGNLQRRGTGPGQNN